MKSILFCKNPYAFGILKPIKDVLQNQNEAFLWYVPKNLLQEFPFKTEPYTTSPKELKSFKSDAIFVPGNEVPHYLTGVKTQIFHGLAGEKKGHFRIRHYFDLYLTQGPYFTNRFNELANIHKDFKVIETGWPKLDVYGTDKNNYNGEKKTLLEKHHAKKILLYAPTFSPKLTSAPFLQEEIKNLAKNKDYLILIKFHDLMAKEWVLAYKDIASHSGNVVFEEERNIIKFLLMADLLISDTSSVIYEFLLLDKPVISFKNVAPEILWENSLEYSGLVNLVYKNLHKDPFKNQRQYIYDQYHPYSDGKSAERMVTAVKSYIEKYGVPDKRDISFFRKYKMYKMFRS